VGAWLVDISYRHEGSRLQRSDPRLAATITLLSEYAGGAQTTGEDTYCITVIVDGITHSEAIEIAERLILLAAIEAELPAGELSAVSAHRMPDNIRRSDRGGIWFG
jgi:hypothetical protein